MNKLFNFVQTKGKWYKFHSFNLGGGAKLYKNFAQKLLAVSLCMAVVLLGTPVTTYIAEATGPTVVASNLMIDNLKYTLYSDGTATLTGYDEKNLPTEIDVSTVTYSGQDYSVTAVGSSALTGPGVTALRSVSLPLVRAVGSAAFLGGLSISPFAHALVSVDLPSAVTLGSSAFYGADKLTSFSAPSLVTVEKYALYKCSSLPSVSLPSCASVGEAAFSRCLSLASVDLPALASVGFNAFGSCTSLLDVSLPSATFIDECAFADCASLRSVSLPVAASLGDLGPHSFGQGDGVFSGCTSLVSVSAPSATVLGNCAFLSCESLELLVLPPSLTAVGNSAFSRPNGSGAAGLTTLFYKQGLDLTAAGVPATANQLAYTEDETQDVPGKTKVTLVSSTNTAPTTVACDAMGDNYVISGVAAGVPVTLTHDWDDGTITKDPTCTDKGEKKFTCTREGCGETKTEAVDALGHAWDDGKITKDPTCTEVGVKTYTCTHDDCDETKTETVDALGHDFVGGACSRCGAVDPDSPSPPTPGPNPDAPPADTPADSSYLEATVTVKGHQQRLRVYDPNGVLPEGTTLSAEAVTAHEHLDDDHEIEHLLSYNISLLDAAGDALPMPLSNTVELCFEVLDFLDQGELEAVLVQQFDDREFDEKPVARDSASWILINTDHFSPYVLIDTLSPEEKGVQLQDDPSPKNNVTTGDQAVQVAVAGLGMTLVLALGIMLRLITNKRKFEE